MRLEFGAALFLATFAVAGRAHTAPTYTIEEAVAIAQAQNPEIAIARKKVQAARGGFIEARSGYLPSLTRAGFTINGSNRPKRDSGSKITMQGCRSNRIFILAERCPARWPSRG